MFIITKAVRKKPRHLKMAGLFCFVCSEMCYLFQDLKVRM